MGSTGPTAIDLYPTANLTQALYEYWIEAIWETSFRILYTYSDQDFLTERLVQDWVEDVWEDNFRWFYTYGIAGELVKILEQDWTDTEWADERRWLYTYTGSTDVEEALPLAAGALSVHPNPVRGTATVAFALAEPGAVAIEAFDVTGRRVAALPARALEAGEHALRWDLSALPAGAYFVRLYGSGVEATRPVVVMR